MTNRSEDEDDPLESEDPDDEMFAHRERQGGGERRQRPRVVTDFVRRAIENTVGSVQNTSSLSKDALNYLLQQGDRGKKELVRVVAHEVGEFLRGTDLSSEVIKVLSGIQIDVTTSIRFRPTKEGSVAPEIAFETNVSEGGEPSSPDAQGDLANKVPQAGDPASAAKGPDARRAGERTEE